MTADATAVEVRDGVEWITLRRPEVLNAMNARMEDEILDALDRAATDPSVRAIVVRGDGQCFSAGHDVRAMGTRARQGSLVQTVIDLDKPVIASMHGYALGAALSLALACDLRVAARTARIGMPFVQRGVVSGTFLLPRVVGIARATPLLFTGDPVSGDEAERIGLVHRAVDEADLAGATAELAARLASGPTRAIGIMKRAMWSAWGSAVADGLASEREALRAAHATEDHAEGARAAKERRAPRFTGR